jgi:hypothetical protein
MLFFFSAFHQITTMDLIMLNAESPNPQKNINRALLYHNYSFRSLEKYKALRSKGGAREELTRGGTLATPTIGRGHFLRKTSRLVYV